MGCLQRHSSGRLNTKFKIIVLKVVYFNEQLIIIRNQLFEIQLHSMDQIGNFEYFWQLSILQLQGIQKKLCMNCSRIGKKCV